MRMPALRRQRVIRRVAWVLLAAGVLIQPAVSRAQVTPSPTNSLTTAVGTAPSGLGGTQYNITDGTRPGGGPNLFHSFGGFSIGSNDIANFSNTRGAGIVNVLGRVTDGLPSNISGQIQTSNFGTPPNLYLINPAGIMFGPGASVLNVGSLHVTTADYVRFPDLPDGTPVKFFATDTPLPASGLTVNPIAFGFLPPTPARPTPAPISIQGSVLQVLEGKTLSVVGGNLQISDSFLIAPGGRVQLGSFASAGEATVSGLDGAFSALGAIQISNSSLNAAGTVTVDPNGNVLGVDGGSVLIRGGQVDISGATLDASGGFGFDVNFNPVGTPNGSVVIRGSQLFVTGSSITANNLGNTNGAAVAIQLEATGDITLSGGTGLQVFAVQQGDAGDVRIRAGSLQMQESAFIDSITVGGGQGADVSIEVGSLTLASGARVSSQSLAESAPAGPGGAIIVMAKGPVGSVTITGAGSGIVSQSVSSEVTGSGGAISLSAQSLTVDQGGTIGSASLGVGPGGAIAITTQDLSLIGGGTIESRTALAAGGDITVSATGLATIAGAGSGIFSGGSAGGSGVAPAGNMSLTAGQLLITDSGVIQNGSLLDVAGNTTITATDSITISDRGKILSQAFEKKVGDLAISAPTLVMDTGLIQASTIQAGDAGNISVNVGTLTLSNGAQIVTNSAASASGRGGDLAVTADSVSISGQSPNGVPVSVLSGNNSSSGLFSTAEGIGNAGTIVVTTPTLTMGDGGTISVATSGAGNAGDIALNVNNITMTGAARVDSGTTGSGKGGTVTVNAAGVAAISSGGGLFSNAEGSGAGGDLNIQAAQLQLLDGATISARSTGTETALAGNVNIVTGSLLRMVNSSITTEATVADGGNISITTTGSTLVLADSQIKTSVQSGVGQGGNITIGSAGHPFGFILLDGSQIRADAFGGPGGNIDIFANVYLTSASVVSASSALSTPGTIAIEATITDVSGSLTQLPSTPLEAAALMRASCAARLAGGKASSLVVAGREGLPLDPSGLLPSPIVPEPPVAAQAPDEEFPWLTNLLRVSYLSLDPNCLR